MGGRMIWTGFAIEIILRMCPLTGGSVMLVPFYACYGCQYTVVVALGVPQSDRYI